MMEERRGGPGWGDPLSLSFIRAWEERKLLPLADLNRGFVRPESPEQIATSYFQAGWMCELMEQRFGMEKLRRMLEAYAQGKDDEQVFDEILGVTLAEVDQLFEDELESRLRPLSAALERVEVEQGNEAGYRDALEDRPGNFFLNLALGSLLLEEGRAEEAVTHLEAARTAFPDAVNEEGPYGPLARAYLNLDRRREARDVLLDWWQRYPLFGDTALQLAELLLEEGLTEQARTVLEQVMFADPLTPEPHEKLGNLYLEAGDYSGAVREFKALLALKPPDEAGARYRLARAFFKSGSREQARHEVLLALEIAPAYEEAQRLLLEIARQ